MNTITLNFNGRTLTVIPEDSSYRMQTLMGKPSLTLNFRLERFEEFPVGTWCDFQGMKFETFVPVGIKKHAERNIEYNMTLGTSAERMSLYKFRNPVDHRLKWFFTGKPHEFLEMIVAAMNEREPDTWFAGGCIDAAEKTQQFSHTNVDAALQDVAALFETEWEIVPSMKNGRQIYTIHLRKVEYFKENPLTLSYGRGNGFVPGLGRTAMDAEKPIKRLYVQGGERNIDRSAYGSAELLLPKGKTLEYEGRTYTSDAEGYYIERSDKISEAVREDSLDCSAIYPSRVGHVTNAVEVDADKNFWDIYDNTIPENLDFNKYLIAGEKATIVFQTGMLSGREFEFKYNHTERKIMIVPQQTDGQTMPNAVFRPKAAEDGYDGDAYAVFGIALPDEYVCDDDTKTGASWDMFREAAKHLYENEEQKFTFKGEVQGLWAKQNWLEVGGKLKVGGYVNFYDSQFARDGALIRIKSIKEYLIDPYSPTVELSNSVSGKSLTSSLRQIEHQEIQIDNTKRELLSFTKRRFSDALDTIKALEAAFPEYAAAINPVAVRTMSMLAGDERLQFRFMELDRVTETDLPVVYDADNKVLRVGYEDREILLQHMTLGLKDITAPRSADALPTWRVGYYESPFLGDEKDQRSLYLYLSVPRVLPMDGKARCTTLLNSEPLEDSDGFYRFLVGVLNSDVEGDGNRSFVFLYGFTEILPGRITTDRVVSGDGQSYIDLKQNKFRLGKEGSDNYIDWNNEQPDTLVLNNATIKETLNVDGIAKLAGFRISNNKIVSARDNNNNDPAMTLDGINSRIVLDAGYRNYVDENGLGSMKKMASVEIEANEDDAVIIVEDWIGGTSVTKGGILNNNPQTQWTVLPYRPAGIAAIGSINKTMPPTVMTAEQVENNATIGVVGKIDNKGDAPVYGGYFYNLKALGLILSVKKITTSGNYQLNNTDTYVLIVTTNGAVNVTLPDNGIEGQVIWVKQSGSSTQTQTNNTINYKNVYNTVTKKTTNQGTEYKFICLWGSANSKTMSYWELL